MKVIDRELRAVSVRNYKKNWILHLECGHSKIITSSMGGDFERAETVTRKLCDICEKKTAYKAKRSLSQLDKFANHINKSFM